MKIQISKEEVVQLVREVIPIPDGFKLSEITWESYNSYMEVEIEQVQPRQTLDRPIFPPPRRAEDTPLPDTLDDNEIPL